MGHPWVEVALRGVVVVPASRWRQDAGLLLIEIVGCDKAKDDAHDAPQANCTCWVRCSQNDSTTSAASGYERYGIHGEVYLWGTVVEHELGYRAQFAYPKNFVLPLKTPLLFTLAEIRASAPSSDPSTVATSSSLATARLFLYGARVRALTQPDSIT